MMWRRKHLQALSDDIAEARALREEAVAKREALTTGHLESAGIVSAIVRRRTEDGFGEELQITFTRKDRQ
jgi:hypothetical protein